MALPPGFFWAGLPDWGAGCVTKSVLGGVGAGGRLGGVGSDGGVLAGGGAVVGGSVVNPGGVVCGDTDGGEGGEGGDAPA
jgi:hypothetical protein